MLITAPILSKGSFLGSFLSKFRQVKKIPSAQPLDKSNNNNNLTKTPSTCPPTSSNATVTVTATATKSSSVSSASNRPAAVAHISTSSSPAAGVKTIEEQVGLPPRPKKPLTPYFRFMKEMRPKIHAENPKFSITDVVRQISKQWETADANLKQKLQEEYKRDQQQYVEKRAKYDANISEAQRAEIKQLKQEVTDAKERRLLRKRIKELGRPKKPASAFLRFISKERTNTPQLPKQTYREWHQKCTEKWARLSDEEKEVFIQETRKELQKYKKAIALWEEKMIRLGHIDVVRHGNLIDPPEPKAKKN